MCQAKVYLGDQEVAHDVIWLEPVAEGVRYAMFFWRAASGEGTSPAH